MATTGDEDFARLLRQLKDRSRRSYADLSQSALTSRSALHRYCTGKGLPPDAETVTRIAKAVKASQEEQRELLQAWLADQSQAPSPGSPEPTPEDVSTTAPAGASRRFRPRTITTLAVAGIVLAVSVIVLQSRSEPDETKQPQWITGPRWATYRQPVGPELFGVTINSNTGLMPSFTTGSVRFWDSETKWIDLQPQRGSPDWTALDRLVKGAERSRLDRTFVIGGTPGWAAPNSARMVYPDGSRSTPPDDIRVWDDFVADLSERYKGRIDAYELWPLANDRRFFTGTTAQLAEMSRRASHIIKKADPDASIVCPGMGGLREPSGRDAMRRFAELGGYSHCDAASIELQQLPDDPPESMLKIAEHAYSILHNARVGLEFFASGPTYEPRPDKKPDRERAANYAARSYLVGVQARNLNLRRLYFYNWGAANIPIVLQPVRGEPTLAARYIERLYRWIAHADVESCGQGKAAGLPVNAWQCEFVISGRPALIQWTQAGTARTTVPRDAKSAQGLDGKSRTIRPGGSLVITEQPVLIRR